MKFFRDERGVALIEFALFIGVFTFILSAIVDYTIYIRDEIELTDAAAAGATRGAVPGQQENTTGMKSDALAAMSDLSGATAVATYFYTCTPGGSHVASTATCSGAFTTPLMYVQVTTTAAVPAVLKWTGISSNLALQAVPTYRVPVDLMMASRITQARTWLKAGHWFEETGSTMLEVAIIMPTFLILIVGLFAFAMTLASYESATYASRQGARFASLHSSTSLNPVTSAAVSAYVQSIMFTPGAPTPTITTTYTQYLAASTGNYIGNDVAVAVTWNQTINVPYFSKTFTIAVKGNRMIEQ